MWIIHQGPPPVTVTSTQSSETLDISSFSRQADHRREAAVDPTFGFGRPKCRIFVSHTLVGKIAQDHVTTDAAGPTPSIDDDPLRGAGHQDLITVLCPHRSTYSRRRGTR